MKTVLMGAYGCRKALILAILLGASGASGAQECAEPFKQLAPLSAQGFQGVVESLSPELRRTVLGLRSLPSETSPLFSSFVARRFEELRLTSARLRRSFSRPERLPGGLTLWHGNLFLDSFYKRVSRKEIRHAGLKKLISEDRQPWIEIHPATGKWTFHERGAGQELRRHLPESLRVYRGVGEAEVRPEQRQQVIERFLKAFGQSQEGVFTTIDPKTAQKWAHFQGGKVMSFDVNLKEHSRLEDLYVGIEGGQYEISFLSPESRRKLFLGLQGW